MDMTAESVARKDFIEWDDYFMATAILAGRFDFIFLLIFINLHTFRMHFRETKQGSSDPGGGVHRERGQEDRGDRL